MSDKVYHITVSALGYEDTTLMSNTCGVKDVRDAKKTWARHNGVEYSTTGFCSVKVDRRPVSGKRKGK